MMKTQISAALKHLYQYLPLQSSTLYDDMAEDIWPTAASIPPKDVEGKKEVS